MIFDDTIRNNVLYGSPDATEAEVWKALEDASLADFVRTLPEGLDTPVGEHGGLLSGGQKQRVSIARAFLRNAPILILDEATSALDSENEMKIKGALVSLMKGRTTFMVAHRFSTIEHATQIVAMADGVVQETGTREELLVNKMVSLPNFCVCSHWKSAKGRLKTTMKVRRTEGSRHEDLKISGSRSASVFTDIFCPYKWSLGCGGASF